MCVLYLKTFRLFLNLRAFQKFQNFTGCHTYTAPLFTSLTEEQKRCLLIASLIPATS